MAEKPDGTPPKPTSNKKESRGVARRRIQMAMERAEEERRRKLLQKRLELARIGVRAYDAHNFALAVQSFNTYLKILEDSKGVGDGMLSPAHFDQKKDLSELLLISGV